MAIRNNHWYNLNEQHFYPVNDTASVMSDEGVMLPSDIIADLRLRWPTDYGDYAFISALSVTPHLVTVLIEAAYTLDNSPRASRLIAGVSIPVSELTVGRTYALTSFQPGAGGFIVLGSGAEGGKPYTGRFSTPRQTLLTPRAARAMRRPPVQTIGVEHASTSLTGLVNLTAAAPLEIYKATDIAERTINSVVYDNVIRIRLVEQTQSIATGSTITSVFSQFAGPCGKRVGSRTCGNPQPIETINGVGPDCNGTLTLEFQGCAVVGRNVDDCGIILDCSLGLSSSCTPPYLPDLATGLLPNELPPVLIPPTLPPDPPPLPDFPTSENSCTSVYVVAGLPYCYTFDFGDESEFSHPDDSDSVWGFFAENSPDQDFCCDGAVVAPHCPGTSVCSYGTPDIFAQSRVSLALWRYNLRGMFRTITTALKVMPGALGSKKIGGIFFDYTLCTGGTLPTYWACILDFDRCQVGLHFFNTVALMPIATFSVPGISAGDWYRLSFTMLPVDPNNYYSNQFSGRIEVQGIDDPSIYYMFEPDAKYTYWTGETGNDGLYVDSSKCAFSYWRAAEITP